MTIDTLYTNLQHDRSKAEIQDILNRLDNLDLKNPQDRKEYQQSRQEFFELNEGFKNTVHSGNSTIGIGFDMTQPSSRAEWNQVFQGSRDFDRVRNGSSFRISL